MKKSLFLYVSFLILVITSCGQKSHEKATDFALKFGDFVNVNQKDSIKAYYSDFNLTDSLANVPLTNLIVKEGSGEGVFRVEYSPQQYMILELGKNGEIQVLETKGILAFDERGLELVKNANLWNDSLSDSKLGVLVADQIMQESIAKMEEEKANRLSINDFCHWDSSDKVMVGYNDATVKAKLEKLGFKCEKTWNEWVNYCEEDVKETYYQMFREKYGYSVTVKLEGLTTEIIFSNNEAMEQFIETIEAGRFKRAPKDMWNGATYIGGSVDCYWNGTDIKIEGHTITLMSRFEC